MKIIENVIKISVVPTELMVVVFSIPNDKSLG